jgi:N-acetylmuramoyl-L-alanine amidase
MAKIYINPGHGGTDSGAVGIGGRTEKTDNLKYAKEVARLLESAGHTVKLERADDTFISVTNIARKANEWNADYFISFHRNAASSDANGSECLVCSTASTKSKQLAQAIAAAMVEVGFRDRGVKVQDKNTYVLKNTKMPATTIECGFVTNATDNAIFDGKFDLIVNKIAQAIVSVVGGTIPERKVEITVTPETVPLFILPVVKKGVKSEAVRSMQHLLIGRGFSVGTTGADGSCGGNTIKGINKFKASRGLPENGICDDVMWNRLING